ncbi:MAG TPA: Ig-like domain-containing protein [Candidatus Acidoferrum sp.]|nr:Ig-like domain-containing protein [Candidatus Acidoferrum sp.]
MKKFIGLIIAVITVNYAYPQNTLSEHEWKVTLKVVDENGRPMAGAKAAVGYYSNSKPATIDGLTDTNGIFTATHRARSGILGFSAEKAGYYTTREPSYELGFSYDEATWNPTITLVLRKVGLPIPMYARNAKIEIPETGKSIGYDLTEGDWVAPYGKGKQSDFIFRAERRWVSRNDFDSSIKLSFPNPGDGLVKASVPLDQGSQLRLPAIAPSDGYLSELSKSLSHTPVNGWKDEQSSERNYYFRVRTVLEGQGKLKSALYGKIYGEFLLDPINSKTTWIIFTYYLNPTPNDRNVEFDPKHNLMKNLKPLEGVDAP